MLTMHPLPVPKIVRLKLSSTFAKVQHDSLRFAFSPLATATLQGIAPQTSVHVIHGAASHAAAVAAAGRRLDRMCMQKLMVQ